MLRSRTLSAVAVAAAAIGGTLATGGVAYAGTSHASPNWGRHGGHHQSRPLPRQIFAPYFETFNGDSLSGLARESGNKYLTLAFLQTPKMGSCTVYWNGDTSMPVSWSTFGKDIAAIRARGGDVIASFGGAAADGDGTEIADSCDSVSAIAGQYEKVIKTYGITRLDLDTEVNPGGGAANFPEGSLGNIPGINRRNEAIAMVENWARRTHRTVQFVYTLPTTRQGLAPDGLFVLQNAAKHHAKIDIVNIMTFDYYDENPPTQTHEMATATMTAAEGLQAQLKSVWPHTSAWQRWRMTGITEMVGVDDYGPEETFTQKDAWTVLRWAQRKGISELSFWALQRDNGNCSTSSTGQCSGIAQPTWYFSNVFEHFTSHRFGFPWWGFLGWFSRW